MHADFEVDVYWGKGDVETIDFYTPSVIQDFEAYIKSIINVTNIITDVDKDTIIKDLTSAGQQVLFIINYYGY